MKMSQLQEDALTEIANIGAGKAAKHLSVLLNDSVKMTVPRVIYGQPSDLPALLETNPDEILVGIEQKLTGFFQAKITFLFFSHDSVSLAQGLIGREVIKETGVDMRALQYDAITEIGNIVIASCIQAMSEVLEGKIQLTLPAYAEGQFCDLISFPEKNSQGESYVLILKTQLEAVRRNVSGAIILVISDADLGLLMKKIDTWIEKLSA